MNQTEFVRIRELAVSLGRTPYAKFTFVVGLNWVRTVTVRARSYENARRKACAVLDIRYRKAGREAPVAFDLCLIGFKIDEPKLRESKCPHKSN